MQRPFASVWCARSTCLLFYSESALQSRFSHTSVLRALKFFQIPRRAAVPSMALRSVSSASDAPAIHRECFVTVGATASFQALFDKLFVADFVDTLADLGYTHFKVQCGPDLWYAKYKARILEESRESALRGIKLVLFDFNKYGLGAEMRGCKEVNGKSKEGIVLSHAGAGSVLDAMRLDIPIIVVPNTSLLDNHQVELAQELQRQGYATYGDLENLPAALRTSEEKSRSRKGWHPGNGDADPEDRGMSGLLDEEVGFELRTREILD